MAKDLVYILKIFLLYFALCIGCLLMFRISIGYSVFQDDFQFLATKQDYIHNPVWKMSFYIHVFTAFIALFAGLTQFSNYFLTNHKKWHRLIGKIYAWNIIAINFPSGMVLAIYANGELLGRTAFLILDVLWVYFTFKAVIYAQNRNFKKHREFMIRSFALTFSAVTLRTWKLILSNTTDIDPVQLYVIDAWLGFVPNLIVAEYIIRKKRVNG